MSSQAERTLFFEARAGAQAYTSTGSVEAAAAAAGSASGFGGSSALPLPKRTAGTGPQRSAGALRSSDGTAGLAQRSSAVRLAMGAAKRSISDDLFCTADDDSATFRGARRRAAPAAAPQARTTMEDDSSASELDSPVVPRVPAALAAKKKKRRGVRLSKQEREQRQAQRLAAAQGQVGSASEGGPDAEFAAQHREQLLGHVERAEWNEAGALGGANFLLAEELLRAVLPLGRHRLTAHLAGVVAATVPAAALAHLVPEALGTGHVAGAAALARGLGVADRRALVEEILRCYERGRVQEAADALGGEHALELETLRAMLGQSRALPFALQYAPALKSLPPPDTAALAAIGAEARSLAGGDGSAEAAAAALAERVRARIEGALRAVPLFADGRVHTLSLIHI